MDAQSLIELLGLEDLSLEEAQMFMDSNDNSDVILSINEVQLQAMVEAIDIIQTKMNESTEWKRQSMIIIAASALLSMLQTTDINRQLLGSRLMLAICKVPFAAAYGVLNSNNLIKITECIQKCMTKEMNSKMISDKRKDRRTEEEEDEFNDDEDNSSSHATSSVHLDKKNLHKFVTELQQSKHLYCTRTEIHILDAFADTLISIVCLYSTKPDYQSAKIATCNLLDSLCSQSVKGTMAVYRSLLPLVTLVGRDPRLPDNLKDKLKCHASAVTILESLFSVCMMTTLNWKRSEPSTSNRRLSNSTAQELAAMEVDGEEVSLADCNSSPKKNVAPPLPVPFLCAIGMFQRYLLLASEKIIPRLQITTDIVNLLVALHSEKISHQSNEDESVIARDKDLALSKMFSFIIKLSQSNKIHHRALCLDIASSLLTCDWIWDTEIISLDDTNTNCEINCGSKLLTMILERCEDTAATVRTRAIGALEDLLESISQSSVTASDDNLQSVLKDNMYRLAVGRRATNEDANANANNSVLPLCDILRDLTCDDKPLVRAKALKALGLSLSMKWPAQISDEGVPQEKSLYVSDDDIIAFSERCGDISVAVRKQAISSLTELLLARPKDSFLQDTWVNSLLPLVHDPESTVQAKVAQSIYDVLLVGAMQISEHGENNTCVWSVCNKIGQNNQEKMLRSAISSVLSLGLIDKSGNSGVKLQDIMFSVKKACCTMLSKDDDMDTNTDRDGGNDNDRRSAIFSSQNDDVEVVSRGGWILLESLVALDITFLQNSKHSNVSNLRKNSADMSSSFVLDCWATKRTPMKNGVIAHHYFDEMDVRMLKVAEKLSLQMKAVERLQMKQDIMNVLLHAQCSPSAIAAAVNCLIAMCVDNNQVAASKSSKVVGDENKSVPFDFTMIQEVVGKLLNLVHYILNVFVFRESNTHNPLYWNDVCKVNVNMINLSSVNDTNSGMSKDAISFALFLLGELAMLGFSVEEDAEVNDKHKTKDECIPFPEYALSSNNGSYRMIISPSLVTLVQMLMDHKLPHADGQSNSQNESKISFKDTTNVDTSSSIIYSSTWIGSGSIPVYIRAQAFVTMGKMCLRSRLLAREHINVFLREIQSVESDKSNTFSSQQSDHHIVRSNSMIVLSDLCIRFTNLVDRHIGVMASCLQDRDVLVRKHTFVLLTQLLLQEYIKWRGMLFFRFLALILDSNEEMVELAKYVLKKTLKSKYNDFVMQNFSAAVIVFNNCTTHQTYLSMSAFGSDGDSTCAVSMDGIDLDGIQYKHKRAKIYEFMLEDISEEQKIQITANLSQDILSYAVDANVRPSRNEINNTSSVTTPLENVLEDTFMILSSPWLRVGKRSNLGGQTAGDDDDMATQEEGAGSTNDTTRIALNNAKTKVLKKISVMHMIEHMLPVVTSLKHTLESIKSPVQKSLMEYLIYLIKNNKNEVSEALSSNPGLKEEIEYDIKQYDKEKEKIAAKERRNIDTTQRAVEMLEQATSRKSLSNRLSLCPAINDEDDVHSNVTAIPTKAHSLTPKLQHSATKMKLASRHTNSVFKTQLATEATIGTSRLLTSTRVMVPNSDSAESPTNLKLKSNNADDNAYEGESTEDSQFVNLFLHETARSSSPVQEFTSTKRRWSISTDSLLRNAYEVDDNNVDKKSKNNFNNNTSNDSSSSKGNKGKTTMKGENGGKATSRTKRKSKSFVIDEDISLDESAKENHKGGKSNVVDSADRSPEVKKGRSQAVAGTAVAPASTVAAPMVRVESSNGSRRGKNNAMKGVDSLSTLSK